MKVKELKTNDKNLFDYIDFFNNITDTTPYFKEFIILYGEKKLLTAIENLYNLDGIMIIGELFKLKSKEWLYLQDIETKLKEIGVAEKTITTTDTGDNTYNKSNKINNNKQDYLNAFDENVNTETNKTTNTDNIDENFTGKNNKTIIKKYSGFDNNRLSYYVDLFKNNITIRNIIYNDIINMIALQIY